jgi:NADPH-dependent 2,4-dienoyl-CoA reductase/sulfur reductase-like enzyme/rhodanese-related sulfurtransferase
MSKRIVIVGGVAGGASAAAKARRMNEDAEIVLVDAGPYISFANCGLPYYVGGEIAQRDRLFVSSAKLFARRFNVNVRTSTRVSSVDRAAKTVTLFRPDGAAEQMSYDRLILATGTVNIVPPIKGLDRANIFTCRTVPDVDAITSFLAKLTPIESETVAAEVASDAPRRAVVIGGGYIGLETAEQLLRRKLKVTVVEMADQLMLALDREMAEPLRAALVKAGAEVVTGDGVKEVVERVRPSDPDGASGSSSRTAVVTQSGREFPFDLAILSVGVRPNVELAKAAGLVLGQTGAIAVDARQRTSDPNVYAAGDNCEAMHLVLGKPVSIPLAGPANKAGRVAGANAALDLLGASEGDRRRLSFPGVLGTAVVRVCDVVAGVTGITERQAKREGVAHAVSYMHGLSHAGYYPGAEPLVMKLVFAPDDGRILGAQVVGKDGVDKRIDVLATAIAGRLAVEDLEELDLCYAPPFASAKDIVVMGGFAASNERRGEMPAVTLDALQEELAGKNAPAIIDVRSPKEFASGHVSGALNVPVDDLRGRMGEVPKDRPVVLYCGVGYRAYVAQRVLMNKGWRNVRNLLGGWKLIQQSRISLQGAAGVYP